MTEPDFDRNQAPCVNARGLAAAMAKLDDAEMMRRLAMLLPAERALVVEALAKHQGITVES